MKQKTVYYKNFNKEDRKIFPQREEDEKSSKIWEESSGGLKGKNSF